MTPRRYITISERRGGWRVSVKQFSGDINSLDRQLAELFCRTEKAARRVAAQYAAEYGAEVLA